MQRLGHWRSLSWLKKPRYEHTIRVMDTKYQTCKTVWCRWKAGSGYFPWLCKYQCLEMKLDRIWTTAEGLLDYHHELWHGPVGALMVKREIGADPEILHAVNTHNWIWWKKCQYLIKSYFLQIILNRVVLFPVWMKYVKLVRTFGWERAGWLRNTINMLVSLNQYAPRHVHAYNDLLNSTGVTLNGNY